MPLYVYRCPDGDLTELQRDVEDRDRATHCAECGKPAQRLHRLGGIAFRGSGFHNTDNPRPGAPGPDTD